MFLEIVQILQDLRLGAVTMFCKSAMPCTRLAQSASLAAVVSVIAIQRAIKDVDVVVHVFPFALGLLGEELGKDVSSHQLRLDIDVFDQVVVNAVFHERQTESIRAAHLSD